ncbi:MAG TPA: ABC-type transport auxiliary lipoprotein family protein [Candidatus Macondimonas sp.]|nr:ABC-type transport auxiliary lipoprotein family protein [Candidatus Macondimonas sp.]
MQLHRIHFAHVLLLMSVSLLVGCADWLPNRRPPPAVPHDLGWLPPPTPIALEEIPVVAVESPPWLSESALRYRQAGSDPTALRRYPDDYWVAPPRELVLDRLQQYLLASRHIAVRPNSPRYRLEVRLLRFEQEQHGLRSEAIVSLQALLLDPRNRRQFASPAIEARVASPSPGAAGAVRGLGQATDQAIVELMGWLASVQAQNPAPETALEPAPQTSATKGLRSLFPARRP